MVDTESNHGQSMRFDMFHDQLLLRKSFKHWFAIVLPQYVFCLLDIFIYFSDSLRNWEVNRNLFTNLNVVDMTRP